MVNLHTQICARVEKHEYRMGVVRVVASQSVRPPEISACKPLFIANCDDLVYFVKKGYGRKDLLGFYSVIH